MLQLAINDCRWRANLAEPIWAAVQEAGDLLMNHPATALSVQAGADFLAARVRGGVVHMNDVAGAEIYRAQPQELAA